MTGLSRGGEGVTGLSMCVLRVGPVSSSSIRSSNAYLLFYELQSSPHGKYQTCRL